MALSSLPFALSHPLPDLLETPLASVVCSRPCSLWVSTRRSQFVLVAAKGKRGKMEFEFEEEDSIPDHIHSMAEWMRNRPGGFGVGKVYDLSLEEKLLAEVEADKAAKSRNGGKGKMTPKKVKVTEAPGGVEVWVGNLPRKRKVERDLYVVFRNDPGLLNIRPIVERENEKTRDPVCRGFAFFAFATEDDAYNFVERYNGEKVKFGKVEKKITCEVAMSDSPWHPKPDRRAIVVPKLQVRDTDSGLPSTPTKQMDRELGMVAGISSTGSFREKFLEAEEEKEEGETDEQLAIVEKIWDEFEDEDDIALDLELSQEEGLNDDDEPLQIQSTMEQVDELSEPVESVRDRNILKNKALEVQVRDINRKLQVSAQDEEDRIELLEKRILSKAKLAVGVSTSKAEGEKKKARRKKPQAGKKIQKIGTPGSATRLKSTERSILTKAISKYVSSSP